MAKAASLLGVEGNFLKLEAAATPAVTSTPLAAQLVSKAAFVWAQVAHTAAKALFSSTCAGWYKMPPSVVDYYCHSILLALMKHLPL